VHGVEKTELLDHGERGAVPALDPARADADVVGGRRRHGDEEGGRRPGHARIEMVFGKPVPPVAQLLGGAHQVDGVA